MRLLYFPTPNGKKVAIALEEMGLPYEVEIVDILGGTAQNEPDFLAVSPNGRIPALVDGDVRVFESGAILQYLGRKSGLFYPADEAGRAWVDGWLFWQMAGLGPMKGQLAYFTRAAGKEGRDPLATAYALKRYRREVRRLYGVMERQLATQDYLAGDYSIADMASWPWVDQYAHQIGGLEAFPAVAAWHARIADRPAVRRAITIGLDAIDPEARAP